LTESAEMILQRIARSEDHLQVLERLEARRLKAASLSVEVLPAGSPD
jgi:hypothetical protein